jgi:hypothetical protein
MTNLTEKPQVQLGELLMDFKGGAMGLLGQHELVKQTTKPHWNPLSKAN